MPAAINLAWRGRRGSALAAVAAACGLAAAVAGATASGAVTGTTGATGASNGVQNMTPTAALAAAASALATQPNVVAVGTASEGDTQVRIDDKSSDSGADSAATVIIKAEAGGKTASLAVRFVKLPTAVYLDGGKGFWQLSLAADKSLSAKKRDRLAKELAGVWIKYTPTQAQGLTKSFASVTNAANLAVAGTKAAGVLTWGPPEVIGGVTAIAVISSEGDALWLPESGPILPLELTSGAATTAVGATGASGSSGASSAGSRLAFSYPATLTISAPARSINA